MHDPKMSPVMAHQHLLLSDKLPGNTHLPQYHKLKTDHLDYPPQLPDKAKALTRAMPPSRSGLLSDDAIESRYPRHLLPLLERVQDLHVAPEIAHYAGSASAFSDLASQYRHADFLYAGSFYGSLHGDQSAVSLPLSIATFSRRVAGNNNIAFPNRGAFSSSRVVIKDYPSPPISSSQSSSTSSLPMRSLPRASSPSSRTSHAMSLSPFRVSATASPSSSSSPSSSRSSPPPHRRSSVSPESRKVDHLHRHQIPTLPKECSSLALSETRPLALYGDKSPQDERTVLAAAFRTPLDFSAWGLVPSVGSLRPPPPPASSLFNLYNPFPSVFESRANIGHLLDRYISSSSLSSSSASSNLTYFHHHFHQHHHTGDTFYNGNSPPSSLQDPRSSPGKELPTKTQRQDRARDRQELAGALDADREHIERLCNVKKSASTQTQFSSFSCENLPPPPYYSAHDTITQDKLHASSAPLLPYSHHLAPPSSPPPLHQYHHPSPSHHGPPPPFHHSSLPPPPPHTSHLSSSSSSSISALPPSSHTYTNSHYQSSPPAAMLPPPLVQIRRSPPPTPQSLPPYPGSPRKCSPPPPPQYTELTRVHIDVQHAPLNLSLSSAPPISSTTPPSRSSLTMSASASPPTTGMGLYRCGADSPEPTNHRKALSVNGSSHETAAQVSDEAIEEHFRRSLGKSYNEPSPPKRTATHVSEKLCSVDDHFARALGDQMWTEIKARSEPPQSDALSGTVDAHFAKALGATMWQKLKAENKLVDDIQAQPQSTQQHQQQKQQQHQQQQQPQHQQSSQRRSPSSSSLQTSLVT